MPKLQSLEDVLVNELKDLYSAESQLLKALPKMAKAASSEELKEAITMHLEETETQLERLEKISKTLDKKLSGKKCIAMEGLIEEGKEIMEMEEKVENGSLIDTLLIGAAQRIEHYEIAGYGTARAIAEALGKDDIAALLQETLDEESATDEKLSALSEEEILPEVIQEGEVAANA